MISLSTRSVKCNSTSRDTNQLRIADCLSVFPIRNSQLGEAMLGFITYESKDSLCHRVVLGRAALANDLTHS
jgi:hypothetical protein